MLDPKQLTYKLEGCCAQTTLLRPQQLNVEHGSLFLLHNHIPSHRPRDFSDIRYFLVSIESVETMKRYSKADDAASVFITPYQQLIRAWPCEIRVDVAF